MKTETTNQITRIACRPGESVFDALARGIAEGSLPAGSRVIVRGIGQPHPTCPGQVGTIRVRRGEQFAVQGPAL